MTIEHRLETQRVIDRLERSEDRFIDKFGDETFEETRDWLRTRPDIERWAMGQRDPWKAAHDQYRREKLDSEVGSDPEAWLETKLAERLAAEREAIRQEILAEAQGHQPAPAPRHTPPPATAGVRSAAPRSGAAPFTGPTPLGDILNR